MLPLTRLETEKVYIYSPHAQQRYEVHEASFITRNYRDKQYKFTKEENIPFVNKNCLVYNKKAGSRPWYTHMWVVVVMDFFVLGWIPRTLLNAKTKIVKFRLCKHIY